MLAVVRCAVAIGHTPLPPAARAGRIGRSAKVRIKELHYAARRATSPRPPFCRAHRPLSDYLSPLHRTKPSCTPPTPSSYFPPLSPAFPHALAPAAALAAVPHHHSPHPIRHTALVCTRPQPYPHAAARPAHVPRAQKKSGVAPLSAEPLRIVIRRLAPKGYLPINSTLRLMKAVSCSPASMPFDSRARSISCLTISFLPPISRRRPSR